MKFKSKFINFHSRKFIWKCSSENSGHFVKSNYCKLLEHQRHYQPPFRLPVLDLQMPSQSLDNMKESRDITLSIGCASEEWPYKKTRICHPDRVAYDVFIFWTRWEKWQCQLWSSAMLIPQVDKSVDISVSPGAGIRLTHKNAIKMWHTN